MYKHILISVFAVLFLTACPPPSWIVQTKEQKVYSVSQSCLRGLTERPDIFGVVKWQYKKPNANRFERYILETNHGIANLDINHLDTGEKKLYLYIYSDDTSVSKDEKIQKELYLDQTLNEIIKKCSIKDS